MKNAKRYLKLATSGLCLAVVMYNCKPKEVASITPFTYSFKELEDLKLPLVQPTAPAAISVTPATVTLSAQADAVGKGLASISETGPVPDAVQKAVADAGKAMSTEKAEVLVEKFTPAVIDNLAKTGTLPSDLQADVAAAAANPMLKAYMPTFTLPQVDGKAAGGRLGAVTAVTILAVANSVADKDKDKDKCKKAAKDAYDKAIVSLDQTQISQTASVGTTFSQAEAAASTGVPACQSSVAAKYGVMMTAATKGLNDNKANLDKAKNKLGKDQYNLLSMLNFVAYAEIVKVFGTLQIAESNTCAQSKDARIASAKVARDKDLSVINANYNAVLRSAEASRDKAAAGCHNQGNGG